MGWLALPRGLRSYLTYPSLLSLDLSSCCAQQHLGPGGLTRPRNVLLPTYLRSGLRCSTFEPTILPFILHECLGTHHTLTSVLWRIWLREFRARIRSVLGYCFLPLVFTALFGVLLPMDTGLGYVLTAAAVGWCTFSSSGMFVSVGRMKGMRGLVAYPLALFYLGFGIMGIFSSRGSGMLQGKVL